MPTRIQRSRKIGWEHNVERMNRCVIEIINFKNTDMFNIKKKLGRRTIKQWFIHIVRRSVRKEYCKICGQELTEIRGRYPKQPRRKVCACCATEKLEWLEEQNNVGAKCSNNA